MGDHFISVPKRHVQEFLESNWLTLHSEMK